MVAATTSRVARRVNNSTKPTRVQATWPTSADFLDVVDHAGPPQARVFALPPDVSRVDYLEELH